MIKTGLDILPGLKAGRTECELIGLEPLHGSSIVWPMNDDNDIWHR